MRTRTHLWPTLPSILALIMTVAGADAPTPPTAAPEPAEWAKADVRTAAPKDLDGYFPFHVPATPQEWSQRGERVRMQMRVSLGLWPEPTRTPLNPVVHGKVDREDYTVERVFFESMPGFYVTGSLYRPRHAEGKRPGVLCPHGHWNNGRFLDTPVDEVRREIAQGAERFEEGARSVLQARCVQLARMGCVVFHYDMIGYADSVQISFDLAHRFAKQRPEMNSREAWGLFSPQAEAHNQSVMGLQTWNSIRALDFLLELPDVDAGKIGVTGASGGGTQTFVLCALDPRPTVAFPAVMVGTAMQGGCTCENASGLRVETGNVEFAALFAPKPLGMTSANDWTKEMSTKGFPELKQLFTLLGAPDKVALHRGEHFGHNYNHVSRTAMYAWMNRHFQLGLPEPVLERDYQRLTTEEMTVWNEHHPKPEGGPDFERKLLQWWSRDAAAKLEQASASWEAYQSLHRPAVEAVLGRSREEVGKVEWSGLTETKLPWGTRTIGTLVNPSRHELAPVHWLKPAKADGRVVIWLSTVGTAGLYTTLPDTPIPAVRQLLDAGVSVIGVDLLWQGTFPKDGMLVNQNRLVANPREAPAYTFGYNHSLFAQRVHDVLNLTAALKQDQAMGVKAVGLVGLQGAGAWAAAARALARDWVAAAAIDTAGFRFADVSDMRDAGFLPGGAKYGDLPGMLGLGAPGRLWLAGETGAGSAPQRLYALAGAQDKLSTAPSGDAAAAARWLTETLK